MSVCKSATCASGFNMAKQVHWQIRLRNVRCQNLKYRTSLFCFWIISYCIYFLHDSSCVYAGPNLVMLNRHMQLYAKSERLEKCKGFWVKPETYAPRELAHVLGQVNTFCLLANPLYLPIFHWSVEMFGMLTSPVLSRLFGFAGKLYKHLLHVFCICVF